MRFVWGASRAIPGRWYAGLIGLHNPGENGRYRGIAVSVRGLLCWLGALAVVAYFAGVTALFVWLNQRPYNLVRWTDVALPTHWSRIRDLRGQSFIAEGMEDMKQGRFLAGEMKLRNGLSKHPDNLKARLTLGQFYLAIGRRAMAVNVLQAGLARGYPGRVYMEGLLRLAAQCEDYDLGVRVCDDMLGRPGEAVPAADRRWLREQKVQMLLAAKRPADLLALLDADEAANGPQENEARVLALIGLDRLDDAEAFLAKWKTEAPAARPQILRLQVRVLREAHKVDPMNRALEELRELSPADPRPLVYKVVQQWMAEQHDAASRSLDDYLLRFGSTTENLVLAAEPLAEVGALSLVSRIVREAQAQGLPARSLYAAQTRALLRAGDAAGAARAFAAFQRDTKQLNAAEELWVAWMERLLAALNGPVESAQVVELQAFLRSRPLPLRVYRETAEALMQAKRWDTARDVLVMGTGAFPASASLAEAKSSVEAELEKLRPAEADKVVTAPAAGPREKAVFEDLDRLMGEDKWSQVAQEVRNVLLAKPAWLGKRESELLRIQMRAYFETGSLPDMVGSARLLMDGSNARAQQVVDFAAEVRSRGDKEAARTLLREVLRKTADYPPARRALKELDAKPAKPAAGATPEGS